MKVKNKLKEINSRLDEHISNLEERIEITQSEQQKEKRILKHSLKFF